MGCPPAHYSHYDFIGNNAVGTDRFFTLIEHNKLDTIGIHCGFYYEFIGEKERALVTVLKLKENTTIDSLNTTISITSSTLGALEKRDKKPDYLYLSDSITTVVFSKKIDLKREDKISKLIENDTITVEFGNGMKYQFIRK